MPTIMPSVEDDAANRDSATIQGVDQPAEKVVLDGDAIPGYDLLGELGRGGMGVVYKARDQKLKRIVALKMILSGSHASEDDMQRFQTEAEAVAKLQHANIVQIFEVAEHEGRPYIALEFADGGSLDQKIAGTPQNATESAQLVETLARAMQLAHDNEIIHRDLKPANILLTAEGEPKITDFGLAKLMDDDSHQTKSGAVMGTPSYMAPEQAASSSATLGPGADVYALGAILYHMLTGRPPFQAETQLDTIMQVLGEEPVAPRKLNSALPVDLETICLKCLEKDIHRRYESADSLAEDLRRFGADEPIQARPVSVITRGLKWAKRRPAVAGMVGISAVALVALVAGGLWYNAQLVEERDIATQQTKVAQQQRELAEAQKEAADRNFKLARDAVDELTTVSENELFNLPQMEPVREALLQKAKAFYETFVEQAAGDPELMAELGKAHGRLGSILNNLGDHALAQSEFQNGIEVFTQLVKEDPSDLKNQLYLARSYHGLGAALSRLGENNEAHKAIDTSITIAEEINKDHLGKTELSSLASSYNSLGFVLVHLGKTSESIKPFQKAIRINAQLIEEHPDEPAFPGHQTSSYSNLGASLNSLGKTSEAIDAYEKAIVFGEQLMNNHSGEMRYARTLGMAYVNLGTTQSSLGKNTKALASINHAIQIGEQLVESHPDVVANTVFLATGYSNLGATLNHIGNPSQAIIAHKASIKHRQQLVKDHLDIPDHADNLAAALLNLSNTLRALGETDEAITNLNRAIEIQEQIVKEYPNSPKYASHLATFYHNSGSYFYTLGRIDDAVAAYSKGTSVNERLSREHPDVPDYLVSLTRSYNGLGVVPMSDVMHGKSDRSAYKGNPDR
jgi:tetratricopeptide (TPR) repeat protein/tRNA A-37 threonylcarbamoyl transferase component Bud32